MESFMKDLGAIAGAIALIWTTIQQRWIQREKKRRPAGVDPAADAADLQRISDRANQDREKKK